MAQLFSWVFDNKVSGIKYHLAEGVGIPILPELLLTIDSTLYHIKPDVWTNANDVSPNVRVRITGGDIRVNQHPLWLSGTPFLIS